MSESQDYEYKLSAIVLVYNGEKFLKECIDSLVNQTLDGLEIILVDDVSTDDSLYICKEFERDYDNVRIIQKEINGGLASSANLGIKEAKGEYIILVDNDDIVPRQAYEKLYSKAKETDSDVVVGRAHFLRGKNQFEMINYEDNVWEEERTFNPIDYPKIFHETFYWNKIMRKNLLIDNNIQLPEDVKVYADRKFSHTVMTYAKKVSIITDCVYLWRIRKNVIDESLSMRRKEVWNYVDRIESFKNDLDYFTNFYKDYFKILMRRVTLPIDGILYSKEFEDVYFDIGREILINQFEKIDNPFDNDLKNKDNLIIYLTYKNYRKEARELLESNIYYQRELHHENGKSYWKLHLFRNPDVDIPDELFEVNFMCDQFLNIDKLIIDNSSINFKNIRIPKYFKLDKAKILFKGKTDFNGILKDNTIVYKLDILDDVENIYELKIPIDDLANFEKYEIYFKSYHEKMVNQFRLTSLSIKEIVNQNDDVKVYVSVNNLLTLFSQRLNHIFKFNLTSSQLKIKLRENASIKKNLKIFIQNIKTNEQVALDYNEDLKEYYLDWKFFLDEKSEYKFILVVYDEFGHLNKKIRLNKNHIITFNDDIIDTETKIKVQLIETHYHNINLSTN